MVYVIVVYDLQAERTRLLRKPLQRLLIHVQNSVFEGEVTAGQADEIEATVRDVVDPGRDESGIVYRLKDDSFLIRETVGDDPTKDDQFI